ncbi:MAG: hypothetical protein RL139_671 [Gemmatimonadota bacterium]|jgi:hypothetical protein
MLSPSDLAAILADEAGGGRVPVMHYDRISGAISAPCPVCGAPTRWFRPPTDQMDPCYICTADSGHAFEDAAVAPMGWQAGWQRGPYGPLPLALLLVHNGAPVAMGCDRAARRSDQPLRQAHLLTDAEDVARVYARRNPGARVVVLSADGREVTP